MLLKVLGNGLGAEGTVEGNPLGDRLYYKAIRSIAGLLGPSDGRPPEGTGA